MIAIEDICTKKCENFNGIDKKSFQKIIDLREKSKALRKLSWKSKL